MTRPFRSVTLFVTALLSALMITACQKTSPVDPSPDDGAGSPVDSSAVSVLFIGASYFSNNNLLSIFKIMADSAHLSVYVEGALVPGALLDYHVESSQTKRKIESRQWDYVVLQGVCTNAAYPDTHQDIFPPYQAHPLLPALQALETLIHANCAETQIIYAMPWAFEDGTLWLEGGTDTYEDMQELIYTNTLAFASQVDLAIAPVGWCWYQVLQDNPGVHYLHEIDYNHPSMRGSYLTACVFFTSVFQKKIEGVPVSMGISDTEVLHFQQTADEVVLTQLPLWKLDNQ